MRAASFLSLLFPALSALIDEAVYYSATAAGDARPGAPPTLPPGAPPLPPTLDRPGATVRDAKRGRLHCDDLSASMPRLEIEWHGRPVVARRTRSERVAGKTVWTGEAVGAVSGTFTAVWPDRCDHTRVKITAVLATEDHRTRVLESAPCVEVSEGGSPDRPEACTWLAEIATPVRDELETPHAHRSGPGADLDVRPRRPRRKRRPRPRAVPSPVKLNDDGDAGAVTVRVLYLYTPTAARRWGADLLESMIAGGVGSANAAMQNSAIPVRFEVADIRPTEYDVNDHTDALADLTEGRAPGVHEARDDLDADLVQLFWEDASYCGYGHLNMSPDIDDSAYGYSTVAPDCISNLSMVHELLHNLGANHDRDSAGGGDDDYVGFGWRYCEASGFRTVMAYSCSSGDATRVPYVSDPNIVYMGKETGTPRDDNASVIRENAAIIARWRS